MIPILTKMAVDRKLEFDHVILLGNYELSYAIGKLSKLYDIKKKASFDNVGTLREEVLKTIGDRTKDDIQTQRLLRIVKEMDSYTEEYNEQMYEVYSMGFE